MTVLLDTNVLSEALKPAPAKIVVGWLDHNFADCAISSVTIFELSAGVALLDAGRRRETLEAAITRLIRRFGERVFAFDTPAAQSAARFVARAKALGLGLHQVPAKLADLQIAGLLPPTVCLWPHVISVTFEASDWRSSILGRKRPHEASPCRQNVLPDPL